MWSQFASILSLLLLVVVTADISLFEAVEKGSTADIKRLVVDGADINKKGPEGHTPLLTAVIHDNVDAIKTLLDLKADFTILEETNGYNLFHLAAVHGRPRAVELLGKYQDQLGNTIVKDRLLNSQHEDGYYPIHHACLGKTAGHAKAVIEFLELGVPHDLKGKNGKLCREITPNQITKYGLLIAAADSEICLMDAVKNNDIAAIEAAVANGADINDKGLTGNSPLHTAVIHDSVEAIKKLLDLKADFTIVDETNGYNLFHFAAVYGHSDVVKVLGEYTDDHGNAIIKEQLLQSPHEDGYFPIHRACLGKTGGHARTVIEFLDLGIPHDIKSLDGKTCREITQNPITKYALKIAEWDDEFSLIKAVKRNSAADVKKAVAEGADMNERGLDGHTALHTAVIHDSVEAMKTLLDLKADFTILEETNGYNLFHLAALHGQPRVVEMLGKYQDEDGNNIVKDQLLESQHEDGYYPIHRACLGKTAGHAKAVIEFLDLGIHHGFKAKNGKTCGEITHNPITRYGLLIAEADDEPDLMDLVKKNRAADIERAAADGADMDKIGPDGYSALHNAVLYDSVEAIKTLLDLKADFTVLEKTNGYNLFHFAALHGRPRVVKLLGTYQDEEGITMVKDQLLHLQHADGFYPIHRACLGKSGSHAKAVIEFLDLGVRHNYKAQNGKTCKELTANPITKYALLEAEANEEANLWLSLWEAVKDDNLAEIEAAVTKGAKINEKGLDGLTALHTAVIHDSVEAIQLLLDLKADFTILEDNNGYNLFHFAALHGRPRVVKLLGTYQDKHGINIVKDQLLHIQHEDGYYPIHRACLEKSAGHAQAVIEFLDLGVPHDYRAENGKTCRELTRNPITKYALLEAEANDEAHVLAGLWEAVKLDDPVDIETAVALGANMNEKGMDGLTALHIAVQHDSLQALKTLLDLKANFTIVDRFTEYNLFHFAAHYGKHRAVELLGAYQDAHGHNIVKDQLLETQHEDGYYPIHRACLENSGDHAKTVIKFLELGVPIDLRAQNGKTCKELTPSKITKYALLHAEADDEL